MGKAERGRMRILTDVIFFKSDPAFFKKEKEGDKCNTVRKLSYPEEMKFRKAEPYISRICIKNSENTSEYFFRDLSDISEYEDLFIFSWYP